MSELKAVSRGVPGRTATIVDIARVASVSKSTVSLVLKGSPLVKLETRVRVESAIRRLGYVYNRGAANLRMATTSFVGMVISDLMNPFFTELAVGIEEKLADLGLVAILANTNEDVRRQADVVRSLREHGVAGIIMSPARGSTARGLADLMPPALPVVIAIRQVPGSPYPYVGQDNRVGARRAVEHLIGLGHRRIAFLGGFPAMTTREERLRGYRDALESASIAGDERLIFVAMPNRVGGAEAIAAALAPELNVTAAFCYNDIVALGASSILAMRGRKVGADFALVGFDDIMEAAHASPPLTTISGGTRELGARAAESLIGLIDGRDHATLSYVGEATLTVRESSGAVCRPPERISA